MFHLIEIIFILNVIKSHFKGSYNRQNLTLVVISYEYLCNVLYLYKCRKAENEQGPVVQSIISLTSSLRGQLVKCFMTL